MSSVQPTPSRPARSVAVAVTVAQVLVILGFAGFYVVEIAGGSASDEGRAAMSILLMVLWAGALVALARGLWRRPDAARTPAIVWNVLLLPVAWGLFQSERPAVGVVVLVGSLAAIVGAAIAGRSEDDVGGGPSGDEDSGGKDSGGEGNGAPHRPKSR